jgi:small subunit ribosomal protein S1
LFVRIAVGITGLLPRSAWQDSTDGKDYETKRKGDAVKVRVARIDLGQRKISLALPGEMDDDTWRTHSAAASTTGKSFGTLGDLLKGAKVK